MKKIFFALVFLAFFVSTPVGAESYYDSNNFLVRDLADKLQKVVLATVKVRTKTVFKFLGDRPPNSPLTTTRIFEGRGLPVMEGRFLLTLAHVVQHPPLQVMTPFGPVNVPSEKLSEESFIVTQNREYKLKPLYVKEGQYVEVALFEMPPNLKIPFFPFTIGNSDNLGLGNFVYMVGDPSSSGLNVREGIVSSLTASENKDIARISNGIYPGDSGGPVVAIKGGEFVLVGLAQYVLMDPFGRYLSRIGGMLKINAIGREIMDKCIKCSDEIKRFFIPPK